MLVVRGFFGIIQHFGWKRVRLIAQDEEIYATVSKNKYTQKTFDINRQEQFVHKCKNFSLK